MKLERKELGLDQKNEQPSSRQQSAQKQVKQDKVKDDDSLAQESVISSAPEDLAQKKKFLEVFGESPAESAQRIQELESQLK